MVSYEEKLGIKLAKKIEDIEDIVGRLVQTGVIEVGEEYEPTISELFKDFNYALLLLFQAGEKVEDSDFVWGLKNYEGLDTFKRKNLL